MDKDLKNKAHNSISRAERARMIMQDEMLQEALTSIKGEIYAKFQRTKYDETEQRDELWRKTQAINAFESYLERVMTDGLLAQETLKLNQ